MGNYQVRALIGCGAMGAVYLAHDAVLDRPVAMKVLLGSLARSPEQVRRFQREARAAAPLSHPNIVRIYEAGVREGIPFMAMEFVDGESFDRLLARSGALPWRRALEIAGQMASALACAHEHGVIHRDVKPSNMLLDRKGRMRLTDFGIARMRDQSTGLTDHDLFLGTPEFMSPEQCIGSRDIGIATDLFSLGVTLYRMISGRMPFAGFNTAALIGSITHETPTRLNRLCPDVPDDVARLVAHLLEKDPKARPESADAVVEAIERLLESDGGGSVMSAALDAFIQDQAKPRELELWTPTPREKGKDKPRRPVIKQKKRRIHYAPVSQMARVSAALMTVVAALGVGYWYTAGTPDVVSAAPLLDKAVFAPVQPGVYRMDLPAGNWKVSEIAWSARGAALVAVLRGRAGSSFAGSEAVLRVSPENGEMHVLTSPASPWRERDAAALRVPQPRLQIAGAPLGGAAMVQSPEGYLLRAASLGDGSIALVEQSLNAAWPMRRPIATLAAADWGARPADPYAVTQPAVVLVSPKEDLLVLALPTENGHAHSVMAQPLQKTGDGAMMELSTQPIALYPESLTFTPDGGALLFVARHEGARALHRLSSTPGGRMEMLVKANASGPLAVSPDGAHVLANVESTGGSEVYRIALDGSGQVVSLGVGRMGGAPLLGDGSRLLATHHEAGAAMLVLLDLNRPGSRVALARFERGRLGSVMVNAHGNWAAASLEVDGVSALAVFDLGAMPEAVVSKAQQEEGA